MNYKLLLFYLFTYSSVFSQCWKQVSHGLNHSVAIKTDGSMWSWGFNGYAQLGDGTDVDKDYPVQIGNDTDWHIVSAGQNFNLALKTDGTIWAWGHNRYGQIGNGTNDNFIYNPVQVGSDTNWINISAGHTHSISIKNDGTLWAWGNNFHGQLGDGTTISKTSPVRIDEDTDWQFISAGTMHTIAIKTDGSLWAWGSNSSGQLGDGTNTARTSPTQIGTENNWIEISAGFRHSKAIKSNNTLWSWGSSIYGESGDGTNNNYNLPTLVNNDNDWAKVSAGTESVIATKLDGSLWSWGRNNHGQLGDSSNNSSNIPIKNSNTMNFTYISNGGGNHSIAITDDGEIWSWGLNTFGQLGDETNINKNYPIKVTCPNLSNEEVSLLNNDIKLYSSPTTNYLTIKSYGKSYFNGIYMYDLSGKIISKIKLNQLTKVAELRQLLTLPRGVYFSEILLNENII